jgi:hypothetical protein
MIFLSGSPELERVGGIPTGRLSGIVNHFVPRYLRSNQLPTYETNCIEDWETKLDKIVAETINQNMTLISGISAHQNSEPFIWKNRSNQQLQICIHQRKKH